MNPKNTLCLIVDIQERLLPALSGADEMLERCRLLIQGLTALDVPFAVTEQYPKGLGNTVSAVSLLLPEGTPVVEKTQFSAFLPEIQEILRKNDIKNVILMGAEAHICMLQTALDLKAQGYAVSLPFECTASRTTANRDNGLAQLSRQGIIISNVESILFQLLGDAKRPAFKTISKLIQ